MIFSDLNELKKVLQIDSNDHSQDALLNFYNEWTGNLLEEFCNRKFIYKQRSEFYQGTGTQALLLRSRPVFPVPTDGNPVITVTYDSSGYFGSASGAFTGDATFQNLVYGQDFCVKIDDDNNSSRSGIVYRIGGYWQKPAVRQYGLLAPFIGTDFGSYKIVYQAGYTVDTLPAGLRMAADLLVARIAYLFPLGMELGSESYEERSISVIADKKDYLLGLVKPLIVQFRNWKW